MWLYCVLDMFAVDYFLPSLAPFQLSFWLFTLIYPWLVAMVPVDLVEINMSLHDICFKIIEYLQYLFKFSPFFSLTSMCWGMLSIFWFPRPQKAALFNSCWFLWQHQYSTDTGTPAAFLKAFRRTDMVICWLDKAIWTNLILTQYIARN